MKLVSAGRFALPVTPSRTEHVAATPRAVAPAKGRRGAWFLWRWTHAFLGIQRPSEIWRTRRHSLHPMLEAQCRCASTELRVQFPMVGSAGPRFVKRTSIVGTLTCGGTGSSNAPVRRFRLCFATPVALRKQFTVAQPDYFPCWPCAKQW
jgi:hypothetical protein